MKVWFAVRKRECFDCGGGADVFGPFNSAALAKLYIEHQDDEWWEDDWYVRGVKICKDLDHGIAALYRCHKDCRYRPGYCEEKREEKREQWRKEHPEEAESWDKINNALTESMSDIVEWQGKLYDSIKNISFGQQLDIKIEKE